MLQMMQKKVIEEGEKETELYEKYVCWCKTGASSLGTSIADATTKIGEVGSAIKEGESKKAQLEEDIKQHRADRDAAKAAMAEATAVREKEAAAYAAENAQALADIDAVEKAVAAISKGMQGSFLQSGSVQILRRLALASKDMLDADRQDVFAFLSGTAATGYAPASGQIVGILKQMHDEMAADIAEATKAEEAAIKIYNEMMAAKKKEVAISQKSIEGKLQRVADLGVEIAEMKNDLGDTIEALAEDKAFLADLEKNCAQKKKEWDERVKTRALELAALADTIKILNDDDALELFKKTLPSASASFVQVAVTSASMRASALSLLRQARQASAVNSPKLDYILLAIQGKKNGFEKVILMIDEMVGSLKKEQADDDKKKEYCAEELDKSDDKKKELEHALEDLDTAIAKTEEGISAVTSEIAALEDGIKALDKMVVEATAQRKTENEDYTELMAQDSAAKEVIHFAKNRLNKFYNPKLYKPPPKRELTEDERITVNMGGTLAPTPPPAGIAGTGITVSLVQSHEAPPPAPETFGEYSKKSEENSGVIAMIDLLVKDLDKEMTQAAAEEKDAQADYEELMKDSAAKRAEDAKSITDKAAAKGAMEEQLQTHHDTKKSTESELSATVSYIHSLHSECDWLVQYYDLRKESRDNEIDALGKAKAVLSGADYSLLQKSTKHLRRRM
jgi:septal ring factor EnvC (AmiA/AmiB activator)